LARLELVSGSLTAVIGAIALVAGLGLASTRQGLTTGAWVATIGTAALLLEIAVLSAIHARSETRGWLIPLVASWLLLCAVVSVVLTSLALFLLPSLLLGLFTLLFGAAASAGRSVSLRR
jgi:hypothetical protein